jgi:hypothetical protein
LARKPREIPSNPENRFVRLARKPQLQFANSSLGIVTYFLDAAFAAVIDWPFTPDPPITLLRQELGKWPPAPIVAVRA